MKRLLISILLIILFCGISFAGELRTTPEYLVLNDPTTNEIEFITLSHYYNAISPYATVTIQVLDSTGVRNSHTIVIRNETDDPESITANCLEFEKPWKLCTGVGTCANDCDETTTAYTDFVAGYGATMKSRGDVLVWQRLQELYETQATP